MRLDEDCPKDSVGLRTPEDEVIAWHFDLVVQERVVLHVPLWLLWNVIPRANQTFQINSKVLFLVQCGLMEGESVSMVVVGATR